MFVMRTCRSRPAMDGRLPWSLSATYYVVGDENVIQCNIRNITRRKEAEATVRHFNLLLEQTLRDRTVQLEAVKKEAELSTYSISHDLRARSNRWKARPL